MRWLKKLFGPRTDEAIHDRLLKQGKGVSKENVLIQGVATAGVDQHSVNSGKALEEISSDANALIKVALEIIESQVDIQRGFVQVSSSGSEGKVIEAAGKLKAAHNLHPDNPLLRYAWASALHLGAQFKSAEEEMRKLAQCAPDFLLAKFALQGWQRWSSMFTLPAWQANTNSLHPRLKDSVKTCVLLSTRDALTPRATLFLRDGGEDFQDIAALRKAKINITTVISPVTKPQVVGIYAEIWDNPHDAFNVEALGVPLYPRGHGTRQIYEFLCLQQDVVFVILDRADRILLNRRLEMPDNMRQAHQQLLKILEASPGSEISASELKNAIITHQRRVSPSQIRY